MLPIFVQELPARLAPNAWPYFPEYAGIGAANGWVPSEVYSLFVTVFTLEVLGVTANDLTDKLSSLFVIKGHCCNKKDVGLIAHEVQEIYPFLVNGIKNDPNTNQSINYIGLIGILIKEVQELKKRVSNLEWLLKL